MLKRLIEVALPLGEVSEQSAREEPIRHRRISTLHIWWARRPLAAFRAAVFASLLDAAHLVGTEAARGVPGGRVRLAHP